jgi:Ni,Fe-hydrogenase III small subunit
MRIGNRAWRTSLYRIVFSRLAKIFFWTKAIYTETLPGERSQPKPGRSVFIRVVDCGSSNAAEQEILAMFNPIYDAERLGFHLISSPRHADLLLVTGPVTLNMQAALIAAFRAMPEPRRVVTIGDDLGVNSVFNQSYAVVPLPDEIVAARVAHIPGDPPSPEQILQALMQWG